MSKRAKNDVITAEKRISVDRGFTADPRIFFLIFCHYRGNSRIRGTPRDLYRSYAPLFPRKLLCNPRKFSDDLRNMKICKFSHFPRIYETEEIRGLCIFRGCPVLCGFPHKCGLLEALEDNWCPTRWKLFIYFKRKRCLSTLLFLLHYKGMKTSRSMKFQQINSI